MAKNKNMSNTNTADGGVNSANKTSNCGSGRSGSCSSCSGSQNKAQNRSQNKADGAQTKNSADENNY